MRTDYLPFQSSCRSIIINIVFLHFPPKLFQYKRIISAQYGKIEKEVEIQFEEDFE